MRQNTQLHGGSSKITPKIGTMENFMQSRTIKSSKTKFELPIKAITAFFDRTHTVT